MGVLLGNAMEGNLRRAITIDNGNWWTLVDSLLYTDPLGDCGDRLHPAGARGQGDQVQDAPRRRGLAVGLSLSGKCRNRACLSWVRPFCILRRTASHRYAADVT